MIHALATAGGLQAAGQGGDGVVALGLMGHAARVEQAHHLTQAKERGAHSQLVYVRIFFFFFFSIKILVRLLTFTRVTVTIVTTTGAKIKTKKRLELRFFVVY